jgi:uncharacterized protein YoxC
MGMAFKREKLKISNKDKTIHDYIKYKSDFITMVLLCVKDIHPTMQQVQTRTRMRTVMKI